MFTTVPYDGHEWRKYGEKISGRSLSRCYYRCTYSPCPAKKKVEQVSHEEPPVYLVTYLMEHTCHVSSRGSNTVVAAATLAASKAGPQFLSFASQIYGSDIGVQKHTPSTSSTISEVSCHDEACSSFDQPTLPELETSEYLVSYNELTSTDVALSSPELPTLSGLMDLESRETANYNKLSTSPAGDHANPLSDMDQAYFLDLPTLESIDMISNYDALDMDAGEHKNFLSGRGAALCFHSNDFDVLDQLDALWSW